MTEIEIARTAATLPVWGWEIPIYLFLGGLTAGVMIVSARVTPRSRAMRLLPFAAPILLSIGMLALFLDLENRRQVFQFYTAFRVTSPMSWGSWILLLIYPTTILFGIKRTAALERINVFLGIALGAYTGILLGTLGARALWSSGLLAPLFLVSGLSTGAAFVMLLPITEEERETIRGWDIGAIAVELLLLVLFFADLATSGDGARRAAALFFGGSYTAVFWGLVVIAGLFTPLAFELLEARRHARATIVAPVLLLAGGLALRWIFVAAGQATL